MLEHSPWDSPLRRALSPKDWPWNDPSRDLLAGIVDELRSLRAQVGNVSGIKQHQLPTPIPRPTGSAPGGGEIETGEATLAEIDSILGW